MDLKKIVPLPALFCAFFRVGMTAFGGPAMIPHLRRLVVHRRGWLTEEDFRQGLSVCQMIPGATVMQLAAYTGLRLRGLAGALTAFAGFGLPAFMLITLLSLLYFQHRDMAWILAACTGLQTLVVAIIASATLDFARKYTVSWQDGLIGLGAAGAVLLRVHPALIVALAMLGGQFLYRDRHAPGAPNSACSGGERNRDVLFLLGSVGVGLGLLGLVAPDLASLMLRMMRVDLFAFGGGFAALPMMLHEVVHNAGWMTEQVFMDGIALGQVTPGPIVLTAAFVGYGLHGLAGATVAAVGIFSPSILLLVWAVPHCDRLLGSANFQRAMQASLSSLGGLMAATAVALGLAVPWRPFTVVLGLAALVALRCRIDVLWVVLVGSVLSVLTL